MQEDEICFLSLPADTDYSMPRLLRHCCKTIGLGRGRNSEVRIQSLYLQQTHRIDKNEEDDIPVLVYSLSKWTDYDSRAETEALEWLSVNKQSPNVSTLEDITSTGDISVFVYRLPQGDKQMDDLLLLASLADKLDSIPPHRVLSLSFCPFTDKDALSHPEIAVCLQYI